MPNLHRVALTWHHTPRDGYGYPMQVPVRLVKELGDKCRVEIIASDGRVIPRTLMRSSLRRDGKAF